MRIEIQIRSRLQHAWATAVETIDTFTGQALKSNIGDDAWKRFFALMGSVIARVEKCPLVPNTPEDVDHLVSELRESCKHLNIPNVFRGLKAGMQIVERRKAKARVYILTLDSQKEITTSKGFMSPQEAEDRYLVLEKENKENPYVQTVLVSGGSMHALRQTYPSYFLDTSRFIGIIEGVCGSS